MAEIRIVVTSLQDICNILLDLSASLQGNYAFIDMFYHPIDGSYDFNTEFVRLRMYQKSQWKHKQVVIAHKRKHLSDTRAVTIAHREFDTYVDAIKELISTHRQAFQVARTGIEYAWHGARIFVEDIESMPITVEIVAPTEQLVAQIATLLGCHEVLSDNVPAFIQKRLEHYS